MAWRGADQHALKQRKDDLYETVPEATHALLAAEQLPKVIWEPAAGRGAIVDVLRAAGHHVFASDLVDYGIPGQKSGWDFLMENDRPYGTAAIVTNPPFKLADEFARHAFRLCPKVYLLLRLAFLEGSRRSDILEEGLARVLIFRNRLPRMHRDNWQGSKATSTTAFGWFCWDRAHHGPTELHRISWQPAKFWRQAAE